MSISTSTFFSTSTCARLGASICLYTLATSSALSAADTQDHHQHHGQHQHKGIGIHSYAPAGVMGDHLHAAGEWMFSYRFMHMSMDGLVDGSNDVSTAEATSGSYNYRMAPENMTMEMHMVSAMYAWNDRITSMVMVPFIRNSMDIHLRPMMGNPARDFTTESQGVGDITIGNLIHLTSTDTYQLHANLNVRLPTGSIDETDDTPMATGAHLPFPMQLGSGTLDFQPGITYLGTNNEHLHWGAQGLLTLRTSSNDNDYTLGNRLDLNAWAAYSFANNISINSRLAYHNWGSIDGSDSAQTMGATMTPTINPQMQGGSRLDLGFGIDLNEAFLNGHRLGLEILLPIHQNLNGIQLAVELQTNLTWQYAF